MADSKITALTENTTPATSDIIEIVDDPGGSPLSQKITLTNLFKVINSFTALTTLDKNSDSTLVYDASTATVKKVLLKYLSPWITIVKTADESTNTDTTVSADSELTFTLAANTKYTVHGKVWFTTPAAADFKYRFRTISATTIWLIHKYIAPLATAETESAIDIATPTTQISVTSAGAVTDPGFVEFEARIEQGGSAGTFYFDWAQNTSNASNTTVKAGSYIEYMVIA